MNDGGKEGKKVAVVTGSLSGIRSTTNKFSGELREICLEERADDCGCVERKALESDREWILRVYPKARDI